MKKILITTAHPAPYFDNLIAGLKNDFIVDIIYKEIKSKEKLWENYKNDKIKLYSDFSLKKKWRFFKTFDLIIFGGWYIKENIFWGFLLKLFSNVKVGYALDHPNPNTTKKDFISYFSKELIFRFSHFLFPASLSTKKYMIDTYKLPDEKMLVFPYVHSNAPPNITSINKEREDKLENNGIIKIFIANRFIDRKGYDIILKALKTIKSDALLEKFELTMAGSGEEFDFYKNEFKNLSNNIKLLGWIENENYEEQLNNCDVYIHASLFEPFGIPPIDAMQRGKYVIVSDGVKSTDVFKKLNSRGICIYDAHDSEKLSLCLKNVIVINKNLYLYASANIKLSEEYYSILTNAKAIRMALNV